MMKGMSIYHVNTRSLFSKLSQMEILFSEADVLCCTETWLDNRFSNDLVSLPGKSIFRCDRRINVLNPFDRHTAGGVCIYMNNNLANHSSILNDCSNVTQDFEILTLVTKRPEHRFFVTICIYKPPKGKLSACIDFLNQILSRNDVSKKEIWILGDFNTDLLKRGDSNTVALQAFAKKAGLTQYINTITRPISDDMISDHFTVYCIRKKRRENKQVIQETVRDYRKFSKDTFCQLISNLDWDEYDNELNPVIQWDFLSIKTQEILSVMCPYKKVHMRKPPKKWLTAEIYSLIRVRKRLLKNYRDSRNPALLDQIRRARNVLNTKVSKAKETYISNLLNCNRKNQRKFWRVIKSVIDKEECDNNFISFKDPETGQVIDDDNACDFVNTFFASIADCVCKPEDTLPYIPCDRIESVFNFMPPEIFEIMLFAEEIDVNASSGIIGVNSQICKTLILHVPNKFRMLFANSMFSGIFPNELAISTVKLLPKSGDLSNPGNWRPISMTNVFSKILEKLVHKQMLGYLIDIDFLDKSQFGFLPGKSTHEAIFRTVQHIYSAINCNKMTGLLLLDMAKAFNCIEHNILFLKMENAGFGQPVIEWFKSYLNRFQRVRMDDKLSSVVPVKNGIAQGTVLGPILFIFYINNIFKCTRFVKMSLFADDCVLYLSGNNWQTIHHKMQRDFDAIIEWTYRNNLRLNHRKTKGMILGSRNKLS